MAVRLAVRLAARTIIFGVSGGEVCVKWPYVRVSGLMVGGMSPRGSDVHSSSVNASETLRPSSLAAFNGPPTLLLSKGSTAGHIQPTLPQSPHSSVNTHPHTNSPGFPHTGRLWGSYS